MVTRAALVEFMENDFGIDMSDIDDDTLLFSTGIIDSFALVTLMSFIETNGGFRMNVADVNLENLDSIGRMMAYIEKMSQDAS